MLAVTNCSGPNVPDWLRDKGAPHFTYGPEHTENQHPFPSLRSTRDAGSDAGR